MEKVTKNFVKNSFAKAIKNYSKATENIGLWKSEKYVIKKYFKNQDYKILDIGCGTGRTTFALSDLGYQNITAVDLTPEMIAEAKRINEQRNTELEFRVGDATDLKFEDNSFNYAIFSFNGMMQIPQRKNRIKALCEIKRVVKKGGTFIFTTHDRDTNEDFKKFWEKEEKIWAEGNQDPRVYEYGDKILASDSDERDLFIHFPNRKEILDCLNESGWQLLEDFYRKDLFDESETVKEFSTECRFWIVKN